MIKETIKVLVIEDNPGDSRLIKEMLSEVKSLDFIIENRERLSTGLERLRQGNIDIILLDLGLPDSAGSETFLQVNAEAAEIPIIILTGQEDDELALESLHSGAQDYLPKKSLDIYGLKRAIRYALERKKLENERKQAEEKLKTSLAEKEVLLKEIHHRVKNNLQVINSLLNLQVRRMSDKDSIAVFTEVKNRVNSIALIHEKLYQSPDLANIDFADYIRTLTTYLFKSSPGTLADVKLKFNLDHLLLEVDKAIPCALIINELVTNAVKYAFLEGKKGEIAVELKKSVKEKVFLSVADNGIGLPADFDMDSPKTLGMQIISALIQQLRGSIKVDTSHGTKFTIEFKIKAGREEKNE